MWTALIDNDYSAQHVGTKLKLFYKKEFQCELEVGSDSQARRMLSDWARLKIPPEQVQLYQELTKLHLGTTVDDISVDKDGEYFINGRPVKHVNGLI